jgi:hypothetical protein
MTHRQNSSLKDTDIKSKVNEILRTLPDDASWEGEDTSSTLAPAVDLTNSRRLKPALRTEQPTARQKTRRSRRRKDAERKQPCLVRSACFVATAAKQWSS